MAKKYQKLIVISRSLMNNQEFKSEVEELASQVVFVPSVSSEDEMIIVLDGADAVLTGLAPLNRNVLKNSPHLRVISNYGVGLDNIDLPFAAEKEILIGWSRGVNKRSVAEIVLSNAINLLRGISLSEKRINEKKWFNPKGREIKEVTLGVFGFGQIGQEVSSLFSHMGAKIIAYDLFPNHEKAKELGVTLVDSLDELLSQSDVFTCHVPFTSKTKNIIGKKQLKLMKKSSILINTSRGGIVDEDALFESLVEENLLGAALDVFEKEPALDSKLFTLSNFIGSAHLCGTSHAATLSMARACLNGLKEPKTVADILEENQWMKEL